MSHPLDDPEYNAELAAYKEAVAEEDRLIVLFGRALRQLFDEYACWQQNHYRYLGWSRDQRLKWVFYIQEQAEQGLPMAQQLMARALAIRMAA